METKLLKICLEIKDGKLRKEIEKIIGEYSEFKIVDMTIEPHIDLLLFELGENHERDYSFIQSLHEDITINEIFLISKEVGQEILLQAIKLGAKDFFSIPIQTHEFKSSLEKFKSRALGYNKDTKKQGKVLSIIGSKGGVGTSTIAVNIAASLTTKDKSKKVVLIDMNMLFGEIDLFLDLKPEFSWEELAKNIKRVDETYLFNLLYKHSSGIHVLPAPDYLNGNHLAIQENLFRLIPLMQKMFDFIVIDHGHSLSGVSTNIMGNATAILIIANLVLPSLANTKKLMSTLSELKYINIDNTYIVVNRLVKNPDVTVEEAESSLSKKIFWKIPNDYKATKSAINNGKPLCILDSKNKVSTSINGLTDKIFPQKQEIEKKRSGFFSWGKV